MKILLDECLPLELRHSFPSHDAHSAQWAGLKGKTNGELLRAAEIAGYDVLLTVDQGIPRQLHPADRKLSIILIRSRTNQIEDLLPLADAILHALETMLTGPASRQKHPSVLRRVRAVVEVDGQQRETEFLNNNLEWAALTLYVLLQLLALANSWRHGFKRFSVICPGTPGDGG